MAVQSFEVTKGEACGDMLSRASGKKHLKIGLLAAAYFEFFRMYANIEPECSDDMQTIANRLGDQYDVVYPGMVSTLDEADHAGNIFSEQK